MSEPNKSEESDLEKLVAEVAGAASLFAASWIAAAFGLPTWAIVATVLAIIVVCALLLGTILLNTEERPIAPRGEPVSPSDTTIPPAQRRYLDATMARLSSCGFVPLYPWMRLGVDPWNLSPTSTDAVFAASCQHPESGDLAMVIASAGHSGYAIARDCTDGTYIQTSAGAAFRRRFDPAGKGLALIADHDPLRVWLAHREIVSRDRLACRNPPVHDVVEDANRRERARNLRLLETGYFRRLDEESMRLKVRGILHAVHTVLSAMNPVSRWLQRRRLGALCAAQRAAGYDISRARYL